MTRVRPRGEDIRRFIIDNVTEHPRDISRVTAQKFAITRQAVNKHLQKLTADKTLADTGKTKSRTYRLCPLVERQLEYENKLGLAEDLVWATDIRPILVQLPVNVLEIWHYGFTEMFNNAIDHSGGSRIIVQIKRTAADTEILLADDGVGIFRKIQSEMHLLDERHAVLELHKGKLTTDPRNHTGEGIFFTSRMFDQFDILSGGVFFSHQFVDPRDWIIERPAIYTGTGVWMKIHNHTARTSKKIFDQFSSGDDYGFNKTIVPVNLARYGEDKLISRSQAKRLLARVELFRTVVFDFASVESIGQAFADEIFRVFASAHPQIDLLSVNANSQVKKMISRASPGS